MADELIVLLARMEQSEIARILPKEHTPEYRLLVKLVNRVLDLESRLETLYDGCNNG